MRAQVVRGILSRVRVGKRGAIPRPDRHGFGGSTNEVSQLRHAFFSARKRPTRRQGPIPTVVVILLGLGAGYTIFPSSVNGGTSTISRLSKAQHDTKPTSPVQESPKDVSNNEDDSAWVSFAKRFEVFTTVTDIEWSAVPDKVVDLLPDWSRLVPGYLRKLQRELSMAPGSLADEIWQEAHDPTINPEIRYKARVRVSDDLCAEEQEFLTRRKKVTTVALARYLHLDEKDVNQEDVPVIAMCGSGGGLRALVAGAGSMRATEEDGLFDCVTYTSGVSGSCWLQSIYYSSIARQDLSRLLDHLKARIGVHITYPPTAFAALTSAPTNKYLLSGVVEKLRGNPNAEFGLVDIYGILLAARLLIPKGELGVNDEDFKVSHQQKYIKYGQNPLPIYTAVRHEIPQFEVDGDSEASAQDKEKAKAIAKKEAWFQWFEISPYETFCEEFSAGVPTWALGRTFHNGEETPAPDGLHLPEIRMPLLMGIFGSAFCATLQHYYKEIRPLIENLTGFGSFDEMVSGHNDDLSKVHPINPALIANFAYGMQDKLPKTTPVSILNNEYIQLMDAGMSNNLPIYPLLRPGRNVEVVIAFDASADIATDNWLSVADGYARQRGIRGWPVGIGWPKDSDPPATTSQQLDQALPDDSQDAQTKLAKAQGDQAQRRQEAGLDEKDVKEVRKYDAGSNKAGELGYCTVWVGTSEERSSDAHDPPPPSKAVDNNDPWQLTSDTAGVAVIYLPFLKNPKVPGVDPEKSEYMSTWNFVYTPEEIDAVAALARANWDESRNQVKATVRAVYERKKKLRLQREADLKEEKYRKRVRLGINDQLQGDHFS